MAELSEKVICFNFHEKSTASASSHRRPSWRRAALRSPPLALQTEHHHAPAEVEGLDSTRINGLREFVQDLKKREKPDLMVLVDHAGLAPSVQLAQNIPEFDVVLSGYTHELVYQPILVGKTIVGEPGSMGSFIG
jgi:hypothetical protein